MSASDTIGPGFLALDSGWWQNGALKCRTRDGWIGWKPRQQFQRYHPIASNTGLAALADPGTPEPCKADARRAPGSTKRYSRTGGRDTIPTATRAGLRHAAQA